MSKQDRQGVRTPSDIERKYDLGKLNAFRGGSQKQDIVLTELTQKVDQFIASANGIFEDINAEIDDVNEALSDYDGHIDELNSKYDELNDKVENMPGGAEVTSESIITALGYTPAQSGFGYGEKMPWLNFNETTWVTTGTFQSDLEAVFASMPMGTCKKVQLIDPDGLNGQKFVGEIWKYADNYGVVTAVNYSGYKAVKTMYDNVWQPWEWEIPPMESGVEYRTTEHYEGLPVYVQCGTIGNLPNTSTVKFKVGKSGDIIRNLVELSIQAISTSDSNIKHILPIIGGKSEIQAKAHQTNTREFTVTTYTNLSGFSAKYLAKYTK